MSDAAVILRPDVQAALDAYLAARVDDATWTAYVDNLGPGLALDVAALLSDRGEADAEASKGLAFWYDPADWDGMEPPGVPALSRGMDEWLANIKLGPTVALSVEHGDRRQAPTAYRAVLTGDNWESEGRYAWEAPWTSWAQGFAVAACRAACHAWSPEWAREQAADEEQT